MRLDNKTAVVTGGGRGIGAAIVERLAGAGAHVVYTYKQDDKSANRLAEQLNRRVRVNEWASGGEVVAMKADVRNRPAMTRVYEHAKARFGGVDILVNNAGINKPTDFDKVSDEDFDEILSVNLKGPFICSQLVIPFMKERDGGSIIHIGSVSGQYGGPRTVHYAASKAGLISLAQVVARFGAQYHIRSNTVAAGLISSEMAAAGLKSKTVMEAAKDIVLGRMGHPEEVADCVVFLASDKASYITAQTINVNGGLYF